MQFKEDDFTPERGCEFQEGRNTSRQQNVSLDPAPVTRGVTR